MAPRILTVDGESRALQRAATRCDTMWFRTELSAEGTIEDLFAFSVNDTVERRARTWRFAPARFHGHPIAARIMLGVPIAQGRAHEAPPHRDPPNGERFEVIPKVLPSEGEFVYYEDSPVKIEGPRPVYPDAARDAGIPGTVVTHLLIGRDGRVKSVKVIRSVAGLDQAAIDAVSRWVYKPALSNNKPVAVWIEVSVPFPPGE